MPEVALITAYDGSGRLLVGKRLDNDRYTLPGGHLEDGEDPATGALRELWEETGLRAHSLSFLRDFTTSAGVRLHCYSAFVSGTPHGNNDPDREVEEWEFIDVSEGLPPKVYNHLHGPTPESGENLVTQLFDLKKAEESLEKREPGVWHSDEWGTSKISIPAVDHPSRPAYDANFATAVRSRYGNSLKRIDIPTSSVEPINDVHNKSRFLLYRKMARKDKLPPLVVQKTPSGYKALDGNHKYHAAVAEGLPQLSAFLVPTRKSELPEHEKCAKCTKQATTRVLWAEGMAYQPACDDHVEAVKKPFVDEDDFSGLRPIKKSDAGLMPDDQLLHKRPLGETCRHGLQVFLVNGEHIRNHVDSDYVQGGNPERYRWIPPGEIWVDDITPPEEIPYVVLHECDEANLMHSHHEGYEEAHDEAKRVEDAHREKGEPGELEKSEVERMLAHPDPQERLLALRLDSVSPEHLRSAALDSDPTVYQAALDHPLFGPAEGLGLMESSVGQDGSHPIAQQAAYLQRPGVRGYHLGAFMQTARGGLDPSVRDRAAELVVHHTQTPDNVLRDLYHDPATAHQHRLAIMSHANVPADVLGHAVNSSVMVPSDEGIELGAAAASHSRTTPEAVSALARLAAYRGGHVQKIAEKTLSANHASPDLYKHLLHQAQLQPSGGAAALLCAMLHGPSATQAMVDEAFKTLRPAALASLFATSGKDRAYSGAPLRPEHIDQMVAHARASGDGALLRNVMDHPMFGARHLSQMLHKADPADHSKLLNRPTIAHQLGFNSADHPAFKAAKILAAQGRAAAVTSDHERAALYMEDGDPERAALRAYGIENTPGNVSALRSVMQLGHFRKDEPPTAVRVESVVAAHPEGEDVAQDVTRAFNDAFVFPVKLGGKHSAGSLLAYDDESKTTWLLKSGSGGAGGAAGSKQDPSNPNAREAAWYHVAKQWGIDHSFPRAEELFLDGKPFAALALLGADFETLDKKDKEEPGTSRRVLGPYLNSAVLHQWAVMDYVCGNPDRHGQNVMVAGADVMLIDHGSAFAGPAFDPAHDRNSFVPYYLRAWAPQNGFNNLTAEEKLRYLPRVPSSESARLDQWVIGLSPHVLEAVCSRYGIDGQYDLQRLARVQKAVSEGSPTDAVINGLWVTT